MRFIYCYCLFYLPWFKWTMKRKIKIIPFWERSAAITEKKENKEFGLLIIFGAWNGSSFKQLFYWIDRWMNNTKTIQYNQCTIPASNNSSNWIRLIIQTEQTTKAWAVVSFPAILLSFYHTFPISKRMKKGWKRHWMSAHVSIPSAKTFPSRPDAQHLNDLLNQHVRRLASWIQHQASSLPCSIHIFLIVQLANVTRTSCSSVQQSPSATVKSETATRRLHVSRGEIEYHASCTHGVDTNTVPWWDLEKKSILTRWSFMESVPCEPNLTAAYLCTVSGSNTAIGYIQIFTFTRCVGYRGARYTVLVRK